MKTPIKSSLLALAATLFLVGSSAAQAAQGPLPTIVGTAVAVNQQSGEFSTLIAAVQRAGFVPLLDGRRQFTVFAPTDAAFAKLGLNAGNIDTVPVPTLQRILATHVKPGRLAAAQVVRLRLLGTFSGSFLRVSVTDAGVFLRSKGTAQSQIVATDVFASNGVIHVIDTVLLP